MRTNSKSIATMKNLFKSLMLVAVAAMAFTACQNEPEANINSSKKSVLNIEASLDQTRSGFIAEEGADALKSAWDGNEVIGLFATDQPADDGISDEYKYLTAHTTLKEGGEKVNFTVEFDEALPVSGTLRACSPYVQGKIEPSYNGFNINVPTTQTPETNNVDPAAHILYAEYNGILGDNLNVALSFAHYAAYGKMTIKGAAEAENVDVKIGNKTYTLSAENVENGVYWFACEQNVSPEAVTVTVNGTDGKSYTKELDLTKNAGFGFTAGRLSAFTVDMTGVAADDAGDSNAIQLTSMTTGTYNSAYYYYAFTFSDGVNSTFTLAWSDYSARATALVAGTYSLCSSISYVGNYGDQFALVTGNSYSFNGVSKKLADGSTVKVEANDTIYNIEMHFVLSNGDELDYIYNGEIGATGGSTPADPVQLTTPAPSVAAVTTDSVTITWAAVANASSYNVSCAGTSTNTTDTTITFTGLEADTDYAISVVAVGDGTNYLNSDMGTVIAHTEVAQGGGDVGGEEISNIKGELVSYNMFGSPLQFVFQFTDATNSSNYFECTINSAGMPTGFTYYTGNEITDVNVGGTAVNADGSIKVTLDFDTYIFTTDLDIVVDGKKYKGTTTFAL